jgi:aryl-alcohol dehydrogenase-like predicted oxidoreductase
MENQFEATLTGSDSPIEGTVNTVNDNGLAYEFLSYDGTLHLIIAKDADGHWTRIGGTEPYFTGWVGELAEQINSDGNGTKQQSSAEERELGSSGIWVKPFAFGGNVFGWTADEQTSFTLLDAFTDAGFNLVDTADVYSRWVPGNTGGDSELIIGNWIKRSGKRDQVVIATKVGKPMGDNKKGLSKAYIVKAVEDSLARLQTDYIDLYQSHDDDKETPLQETLEAYAQLINQGKIRAIGASNYSGDRLAEALQVSESYGFPIYQTLQPEYNLYDRQDYETNLEPLILKKGIGVISYYSLASGFLTGKYRSDADLSQSQRGKGVQKYLNERGYRILKGLDEVASRYNTTPAAVALAWLIARPGITAPIASATNVDQLNELTKAASLNLDAAAISLLNTASQY